MKRKLCSVNERSKLCPIHVEHIKVKYTVISRSGAKASLDFRKGFSNNSGSRKPAVAFKAMAGKVVIHKKSKRVKRSSAIVIYVFGARKLKSFLLTQAGDALDL